jgi:signal transduction histidine kinase
MLGVVAMTVEPLSFVDDAFDLAAAAPVMPWKVAIVDDDEAVHEGTRFALRHFRFDGRPIEMIGARSAAEGLTLLRHHADTAVVLLDVVMESDDAGLCLARSIRQELGNELVRIILRTGHPGEVPEHRIVLDYDINDYKAKTELTAEKLFISITSALRGFGQLKRLNDTRLGLELIVEAAGALFEDGTLEALADGALSHLKALLDLECDGHVFFRPSPDADPVQLFGSSEAEAPPYRVGELFQLASEAGRPILVDQHTLLLVRTGSRAEFLVCLDTTNGCDQTQRDLVSVFSSKLAIAIDKARLYEELRLQNAALEQRVSERTADLSAANQRLDAQAGLLRRVNAFKNEILGTVAHDLKNPLAVILGRAEMLRTLAQDMAEPKATLVLAQVEHVCTAARRMTRIVDVSIADALADALDIVLDRRNVDLAAIVRNTTALARTLCEAKGQTLEVSAPERLVVCCDPDRTTEAIENLLSNAAKYAPPGGRIGLTLAREGTDALVTVDDSGPGLTPEDAIRVFGRFQRLSAQPTGGETSTGLGLSIVRKIAELHGGRVEATEKGPLGGATFIIVLPLEAPTP